MCAHSLLNALTHVPLSDCIGLRPVACSLAQVVLFECANVGMQICTFYILATTKLHVNEWITHCSIIPCRTVFAFLEDNLESINRMCLNMLSRPIYLTKSNIWVQPKCINAVVDQRLNPAPVMRGQTCPFV